jgi:uncharacterized membrane protein
VDRHSADGAKVWAYYQATWTVWNHVRMLTGAAAAAPLVRALR